jgi:hypothetical protein
MRRALVLCSVAIALYVIIGTWTDRTWWYGLFWDDRDRISYAVGGLRWLVDEAFWLAFGIVIALIIVIVLGRLLKHRLFKTIDSAPWVIIVCVWLAVAADALVLRHTQAYNYLWGMKIDAMLDSLEGVGAPPEVVPPIYFYYVDKNRAESL